MTAYWVGESIIYYIRGGDMADGCRLRNELRGQRRAVSLPHCLADSLCRYHISRHYRASRVSSLGMPPPLFRMKSMTDDNDDSLLPTADTRKRDMSSGLSNPTPD